MNKEPNKEQSNNLNNETEKEPVKFDKFEKLDRKVEETIQEVETMGKRKFVLKAVHTSFAGAAVWALSVSDRRTYSILI